MFLFDLRRFFTILFRQIFSNLLMLEKGIPAVRAGEFHFYLVLLFFLFSACAFCFSCFRFFFLLSHPSIFRLLPLPCSIVFSHFPSLRGFPRIWSVFLFLRYFAQKGNPASRQPDEGSSRFCGKRRKTSACCTKIEKTG